jgi:hypothetical protein
MDTLVSLGIVSACGWSAYAMFFLDRARTGTGQDRAGPAESVGVADYTVDVTVA